MRSWRTRRAAGVVGGLLAVGIVSLQPGEGLTAVRAWKVDDAVRVSVPLAPKADLDGDRLFDDLEERLIDAPSNERLPIIVTLEEELSGPVIERLVDRVGPLVVTRQLAIINGFAATATVPQIRLLAELPGVARVEENSPVHATNDSAQSSFGVTKARLDLPGLDGDGDGDPATYSGADLVAAVIDTGIDPGHVDLDDGKVIGFHDLVNGRTVAYDDQGHGSHVAATIAGDGEGRTDRAYKGVAPAAALVGVKVLDANGSGTMADVTAGIDWVVANKSVNGIEVINLSLGSGGCSDGTDATSKAVDKASAAGIVVVVAAGNGGPGTCTIGSPGAAKSAITVGAMADLGVGGFGLAAFSSRGPTADNRIKPDVVGPGVSISSADAGTTNGYILMSGTSMATPFAVGTALLILDAAPGSGPEQVKAAVTGTAVDWASGGNNKVVGSTGPDIDYGAGRLDSYAALSSVVSGLAAPPRVPGHARFEGSLSATGAQVDIPLYVVDSAFPLTATFIEPGVSGASASSPDLDIYLLDANGAQVALSESSSRQESVSISPVAGRYTLRLRSYNGPGAYLVDVSAGLGTPPPPPATVTATPSTSKVLTGSLSSGSAASLGADDNAYLVVKSNTSYTKTSAWQVGFTGIPTNPSILQVSYQGKNSRSCTQTVDIWRFTDSTWVKLDSRAVGTTEVLVADRSPGGTLANFVGAGGEVRVRVRCQTRSGSFTSSGDLLRLSYATP